MNPFSFLQCGHAPFSRQAEPERYRSPRFRGCLEKLLFAVRMRSGLNLVTGPDGGGKSHLLDALGNSFLSDPNIVTIRISGPELSSPAEFINLLAEKTGIASGEGDAPPDRRATAFSERLFKQCVDAQKTLLLLIDKAHLLPATCFPLLDGMYNRNVDDRKIFQVVLAGRPELTKLLKTLPALRSRVHLKLTLPLLTFRETRQMIRWHLDRAASTGKQPRPFTTAAMLVIHRVGKGEPDTILDLCHYLLLTQLLRQRRVTGWLFAQRYAGELLPGRTRRLKRLQAGGVLLLLTVMTASGLGLGYRRHLPPASKLSMPLLTRQGTEPGKQAPARPATTHNDQPVPVEATRAGRKPKKPQQPAKPPPPSDENIIPVASRIGAGADVPKPQAEGKRDFPPVLSPGTPGSSAWHPSDFLGTIRTQAGETLGDMIRRIYGPYSFDPEHMEYVLLANPHIRDPDRLAVDDPIRFPAMPVHLPQEADELYWLKLTTTPDLQSAYRLLRIYENRLPPLLIIPRRSGNHAPDFAVILQHHFRSAAGAGQADAKLPPDLFPETVILAGLPVSEYYYSNSPEQQE